MTKRNPPKIAVDEAKLPGAVHEMVPADRLRAATGVTAENQMTQKLNEIQQLLFFPEGTSTKVAYATVTRAIELLESLKPADGAETMLAQQMVGTHFAALECLRRAALTNQTFEGRDMALKHAQKLMALYAKQLETLNKHRGKGQQKVTVEHVHVADGGQAIVGNVETGAGPAPVAQSLEHKPAVPIDTSAKSPVKKGAAS